MCWSLPGGVGCLFQAHRRSWSWCPLAMSCWSPSPSAGRGMEQFSKLTSKLSQKQVTKGKLEYCQCPLECAALVWKGLLDLKWHWDCSVMLHLLLQVVEDQLPLGMAPFPHRTILPIIRQTSTAHGRCGWAKTNSQTTEIRNQSCKLQYQMLIIWVFLIRCHCQDIWSLWRSWR